MVQDVAPVSCVVEVYGYEGGVLTLTSANDQILSCTVQKKIRGGVPGSFAIELAPGGPGGTEDQVTWSQIITVGSLVVIGMQRGDSAGVVMVGVVTNAAEQQDWLHQGNVPGVVRTQVIRGQDFAWFFNSFTWASLSFLGMVAGQAAADGLGIPDAALGVLAQGTLGNLNPASSNPSQIAQAWYNEIMAGETGVLGRSYVPYQGNPGVPSRIPFNKAVATHWEDYPGVYIPYAAWYFTAGDSWTGRFMQMLPPPFYEFFITTSPTGAYSFAGSASGRTTVGYGFGLKSLPMAGTASPMVVARVMPFPNLNAQANGGEPATLTDLDMSRWNALPVSGTDYFLRSEVSFDSDEVRNFYCLNPTYYRQMFGDNSMNTSPYIFSFAAAADPASIHRYGYRPEFTTTEWLADIDGLVAAAGLGGQIPQSVANLTMRAVSYYHPTPLMARARVSVPLRPDIIVGTRFRYQPFKAQPLWEFYVEGVSHTYRFGGRSTTVLNLSRGLPVAVYQDAQGLLRDIYLGLVERKDGVYVRRTDTAPNAGQGAGLLTFSTPASIRSVLGQIAQVYVTPQAN